MANIYTGNELQGVRAFTCFQLFLEHIYINGLKSNSLSPATLAGQVDNDRICNGDTYSNPYGT